MALSSIGGKFKGVISKDQDLLDAAKNGNVEAIGKLTAKKRQSTASQFLPSFLKGSVNINCADREGYTPLHLAALNGHKAAVECLLKLEASVSIQDNSGCTPLHLAAWKGYEEICKLFLTFSNVSIPIDLQNSLGDTALHMAAQYGYHHVVNVLLQYHADPTIRNLKDESPLDLAAQYGKHEVVQLLVNKNQDLVKHMVTSHSPLHLAAACGHVQIISTLLDKGFDINTQTVNGTALHIAAMYCKTEVVKRLIESGIDLHAANNEGKTALELVLKNDQQKYAEIAKIIRDHIMKSDISEDTTKFDDSNVYGTAFVVESSAPPLAPKLGESDLTKNQKDKTLIEDKKDTDVKTRPVPKPRLSIGESEEDRKSTLYAKSDKDKTKQRGAESPPAVVSPQTPKVLPRVSVMSKIIEPNEEVFPPDLPKKDTNIIPPLPPKNDDVPSLPPKVMSPTPDIVVADLPRSRTKSEELVDAPPPCVGGTVEPEFSGGYFVMKDKEKKPLEAESTALLSPATQKKTPVKPPRKKSPAPTRKTEGSPLLLQDFGSMDDLKEGYETMSNVVKPESDLSFSEDVYKTLFPSLKTKAKNSDDANSDEDDDDDDDDESCDTVYTNTSSTADLHSNKKTREGSESVPFTKYSDENSGSDNNLIGTERKEYILTESRDEIYQHFSDSNIDRMSTGFQQVRTSQVDKTENESHLTSVIESDEQVSNVDKDVKKKSDCVSSTGDCLSDGCDSRLKQDKHIPDFKSKNIIPGSSCETEFPDHCSKNSSHFPDDIPQKGDKQCIIPNEDLNNDTKSVQNCCSIPPKSCDRVSHDQVSGMHDAIGSNSRSEITLGKQKVHNSSEALTQAGKGEISPKRSSFAPELPPKCGSKKDLPDELMSAEKRISNGSHESKGKLNYEENKVPKPRSLEFTKKRGSEEKFPTTPTGYPQPPTPDFPPPSPNTALKGIEQKIAGIEVPSTKRLSRDIETITEDLRMDDKSEGERTSGVFKTETCDIDKTCEQKNEESASDPQEVKTESESSTHDQKSGADEEVVVMRRSTRLSSSGSGQEVLVGDDLEPFAGLLRGSAQGGPRKVISQIYENVALPNKKASSKRTSLPLGNMTFEPVMEREEDVVKSDRKPNETRPVRTSGIKEDGSFDDNEEWDQIADIMASFGAGIDRESVCVEKFVEALFTKHLSSAGSKLTVHSVGEWLECLGLGQYENTLYANGFDDTDFLGEKVMEEQDLENIGITTKEHRKKILDQAKLLPQITPIRPDVPPESVEVWLNSLHLPQYLDKFMSHKYDSMERVLQVWELELSTVLDILSLGHRKRILASLGERSPPERQFSSLKKKRSVVEDHKEENKSLFKDINLYKDYTKVKPLASSSEEEVNKSSKPQTPSVDNSDSDEVFQNNVQGKSIKDTTIHIRPPHQANTATPLRQWRHRPEMLIKGCCNYTAQYLGSTLVRELTGTGSTIEGITKLKKSADAIAKIPTIMLSISYRGVKFIDAKSKKVICDHEIVNIFCACQDAESMNFFAYITRDNETGKHYCHVFSVRTADLAREVIMTLGEAFEVAYQMAQKEKAAEEAKEFERTLSHSDADDSSQSKSSSKASLNTE